MIRTFFNPDLDKISILSHLILFVFLSAIDSVLQVDGMKVHPVATKRNIEIRDAAMDSVNLTAAGGGNPYKRLRRLPHVFGKVLELPFPSDADVAVEESSDCLRFVAETDGGEFIGDGVRAHAVEIHPGVTKIVVRNGGTGEGGEGASGEGGGGGGAVELLLGKLEVDAWRFRLPATTRPELASAVFVDGELIVTVPKSREITGEAVGGVGRLVLVQ